MEHTFLVLSLVSLAVVYGQNVCDVTKEPDIQTLDIRLPIMPIPSQRTFYICQQFKVPEDETYHAVAFEPLINNKRVMHHMLLFGCEGQISLQGPHHCVGEDANCKSWLAVWTIGREGQICNHPDTGVRFGKGSFKYFALQIHWNNAELANNLTDNSGMRIFYTRNLRQYDVGNVQIGQNDLEIPPLTQDIKQSGSCSSACTRRLLPHPVYLTRTYLHMHGLGAAGSMDLYSEGQHVQQIAFDADYQYHLSPVHVHDEPVQVKPGDEVRVSCWFDSSSGDKRRNQTVYYGEGSDAEMCYAFVTYYPFVPDFDQCIQFDRYDSCDPSASMDGCELKTFSSKARVFMVPNIEAECEGKANEDVCLGRCQVAINVLKRHPCMQNRLGEFSRRVLLRKMRQWKHVDAILSQYDEHCTFM